MYILKLSNKSCSHFVQICRKIQIKYLLSYIPYNHILVQMHLRKKVSVHKMEMCLFCLPLSQTATKCAKDCGPCNLTCMCTCMRMPGFMPALCSIPSYYFNVHAIIFFLNLDMWRIEFTYELTFKRIIISIFLTMKATILDTHGIWTL